VRRSISYCLFICFASANANAQQAPAAPAAPTPVLDLVPVFVGACMNPGPDPEKIRQVLIKAGGTPGPDQVGKSNTDPTRLSGYLFKRAEGTFSVLFNKAGTCSVFSQAADLEKSKASLALLVSSSMTVFDVTPRKDFPTAEGETVAASYVLSSKKTGARFALTLSKVTREGSGSATILSRRIMPK
jgi:hypothetical protein